MAQTMIKQTNKQTNKQTKTIKSFHSGMVGRMA